MLQKQTACRICALTLLLLGAFACPGSPAGAAEPEYRLIDGYIPRFLQKRDMNEDYGDAVEALAARIIERNHAGEELPCSSQILDEVHWLINYTNRRERVEQRIADLRLSLRQDEAAQAHAAEQQAEDGAWGACYTEWFFKAHESVDPLKELALRGERASHPLRFLAAVNSPEKIKTMLESLVVSNVSVDGIDNRKALNLVVTALGQLLFLPELAPVLDPDFPRGAVAEALARYMDDVWQDPETGYWGAWYVLGGETVKTEDLSITFHIASYRAGSVPRYDRLIRTTFRIRERAYPYGWQDRGTQNTHHTYDVVRLLRMGWPQMSEMQQARTRAEIAIILARTLRLSFNSRGLPDARPFRDLANAYYFGVSLLDEVGYFRMSRNFWLPKVQFEGEELRQAIIRNLAALDSQDPMARAALRKVSATD